MSPSRDTTIREWFESVWNHGLEEAIDRLMEPAAEVHGCRVFGRHAGDFPGGPATNTTVEFRRLTLACVENGQIVEGWNCFERRGTYPASSASSSMRRAPAASGGAASGITASPARSMSERYWCAAASLRDRRASSGDDGTRDSRCCIDG